MKNVIILRGVSGSGKSTFANLIAEPKVVCSADDFFYDSNGVYNFEATKLGQAHGNCMRKFDEALANNFVDNVVVANTNTSLRDISYYVDKAQEGGHRLFSVIIENRNNTANVHNVPDEVMSRQMTNLLNNIKLV